MKFQTVFAACIIAATIASPLISGAGGIIADKNTVLRSVSDDVYFGITADDNELYNTLLAEHMTTDKNTDQAGLLRFLVKAMKKLLKKRPSTALTKLPSKVVAKSVVKSATKNGFKFSQSVLDFFFVGFHACKSKMCQTSMSTVMKRAAKSGKGLSVRTFAKHFHRRWFKSGWTVLYRALRDLTKACGKNAKICGQRTASLKKTLMFGVPGMLVVSSAAFIVDDVVWTSMGNMFAGLITKENKTDVEVDILAQMTQEKQDIKEVCRHRKQLDITKEQGSTACLNFLHFTSGIKESHEIYSENPEVFSGTIDKDNSEYMMKTLGQVFLVKDMIDSDDLELMQSLSDQGF